MKRILSIVLALVMVCSFMAFSASAAAATPIITVTSNASNPAAAGDVTLKLHLNKFDAVAAAKIDITFKEGVTFKSLVGDKFVATQGKNFVYNEATRTLTIIDLFKIAQSELALTVNVASDAVNDYDITVNGLVIGDDEKEIESVKIVHGSVVIGAIKSETGTLKAGVPYTPAEKTDYFVPYGGVYTQEGNTHNYVLKNEDGSFTSETGGSFNVNYFKAPTDDKHLTTFGSSKRASDSTLSFGTFVETRVAGATYGTMLIAVDDYKGLINYYNSNGVTDGQLMKAIMTNYQKVVENNGGTLGDKKFVNFNAGGYSIDVYDIAQEKFMWGGKSTDSFQYCLRVKNIQDKRTYVAVGYQFVGGEYTFSTEIKSATL